MQHHGHQGPSSRYSLAAADTTFEPGIERTWTFEVLGPQGRPKSYQVQHEKELHLIVVRNDLSTFLHVHPERRSDGSWEIDVELTQPGEYTAFTDVAPDDAGPMTLSLALMAEGSWESEPLPNPRPTASADGYDVELAGTVIAGEGSDITFHISRDGEPVEPETYLGAAGHLVAIRAGDLAYLHVHPMESSEPGAIPFMMHASGAGPHRLFLQFQHEERVRTAAFTMNVEEARSS